MNLSRLFKGNEGRGVEIREGGGGMREGRWGMKGC